jgi:hypothetical protein
MRLTPRLLQWLAAALAVLGLVPAAAAADLGQAVCSPWVPATALSLTLVTAVIKSQK